MAQKYRIATIIGIEEVEGVIKTFKECPNEKFGLRHVDGFWEVTHLRSGYLVARGVTRKICLNNLMNVFNDSDKVKEIHEAKDIEIVTKEQKEYFEKRAENNRKFHKLRDELKEHTGITCPIDPLIGGIDIIRFDKMIGTPEDVSMSDFIKNKWGDRANQIIDEMVDTIA